MTTTETTTIVAFLAGIGVGVIAMTISAWLVRRCRFRAFRRQFLEDVQNSRVTVLDPGTWPWSTTRTDPPAEGADRGHPTGPAA